MSQLWDTAEEAGEKSRPNTQFGETFRIPELVQKKYQATQGEGLKAVMDKLSENVLIAKALTARAKSTSAGSNGVPGLAW